MSEFNEKYDYSSATIEDEEGDFFLASRSSTSTQTPSPSTQNSKLQWLMYATVATASLLVGGAIGYIAHRATVPKGLAFADTSHLQLCKTIYLPCQLLHT